MGLHCLLRSVVILRISSFSPPPQKKKKKIKQLNDEDHVKTVAVFMCIFGPSVPV